MTVSLVFDALGIRLGGREVLRDVSFGLEPGEVVALAGPNGAGKTTLFRVASRVLEPDRGRVLLGGRPLAEISRRELARQIAVVPQDAVIPFPFSAAEVVLMGRSPHLGALGFESRRDIEIARSAMARVGIETLADRSVLELSGGERQLVLVARALAQEAQILLLDEPTAHLDLRHRLAVLEQVSAFAAAGGSALVVSHDLGLAARTCHRIALLKQGHLAALGPPAEVLTRQRLREVFGVEADILQAPDGALAIVARAVTTEQTRKEADESRPTRSEP